MSEFPKVLVAAPQAAAKKYAFERFIDNVMQFTYPNFEIKLFDNTDDQGAFTGYMNDYVLKCINNVVAYPIYAKIYSANNKLR